MPVSRISAAFEKAKSEQRTALVTYIMAGDPDMETSYQAMNALVENGADLIELGAPFTDPMADGPSIQRAGQRSLKAGTKLRDVLALAKRFRETNQTTPVILMGYANPIHHMGYEAFAAAAAAAGIDGVITVDLPPEEDAPLRERLAEHEISVIRLATPTTTEARMARVAEGASGFLYFVSVTGVTGAGAANPADISSKARYKEVARDRWLMPEEFPTLGTFPEDLLAAARDGEPGAVGTQGARDLGCRGGGAQPGRQQHGLDFRRQMSVHQ